MGAHKKRSVGGIVKGTFANIGRVIAALIMVGIITGCIVASVMTVYILRYINSDEVISLDDLEQKYTTILYYEDGEGNIQQLQQLQTSVQRFPVTYEQIPQHMLNALIAIEDQRFYKHHGVDWKRTFGAFVTMFIPGARQYGGSTITQQLIKNITGDDEVRIERKVQEIFRALKLEQRYSKEQIITAYLNTVFFSSQSYGVQAAAKTYFNKDVWDLSLAECASIIGITNYPSLYNPFLHPEDNKKRQENILYEMHRQGLITDQEYEEALDEELVFAKDTYVQQIEQTNNYFVDHVIEEVLDDLQSELGYTYEYAQQQLYGGGYRIYTTVNKEMQDYLDNFYSDVANFPPVRNEDYPQSACVITDPNGKILALEGGIGKKEGSREFNRATQAKRQSGSAIKPLAAYLQGIERDVITWSTMIDDHPIPQVDPETGEVTLSNWPVNFQGNYLGPITVDQAIQQSRNTVAVKIVNMVGPKNCFDFLKNKLGFDSLVERRVSNGQVVGDVGLAPMALGAQTDGVTPLEMAGGYQIYANGGYFTKPYAYTEIRDADDNLILKKDTTPRRVISAETATIVNRLMQRVVYGPYGTGSPAAFPNMSIAGKTGTSDDDYNQWFMGITPYYVCAVWMGYDIPETIHYGNGVLYAPPLLWKSIMQPLHEGLEAKQFPVWGESNIEQATYCTETGELALDTCPTTATGWYKKSNLPPPCSLHSDVVEAEEDPDFERGRTSSKSSSKSSSKKSGSSSKSNVLKSSSSSGGRRIIDNDD